MKYKMVQICAMHEDRNKEDCILFNNCIPQLEITVNFEAKSWPKHVTNV